ncbi:MAG: putative Ig domain-containing protein, partial [Verrucomicrobia bacterium]|nr:putative Ig domain-containing protein [Verrucomicrobiota bacterium]
TLTVTNFASDADIPANLPTFALVSAPTNMVLNPASGVITWTPAEAQGPSNYVVIVRVYDNGSPVLSATNSFTVAVNEVNVAPVLPTIATQIVYEGRTLTVTNRATDTDVPTNRLTYELLSAPLGASIGTNTGIITWTTTFADGPGTYMITTRVEDENTNAVNSQHLSATNTFDVVVKENTAPVLLMPANQVVNEMALMAVTLRATDADVPTKVLTFGLVSAPTGVSLNTNSGLLTWTPTEAQGPGTYTITAQVTDNGLPSLSATNSFDVTVREVNVAPVLPFIATKTIDEGSTLVVTNTATDADSPANPLAYALVSAPTGMTIDTNTGVITWTPTEVQGPGNYTVITRVEDYSPSAVNATSLSATNSFSVTVSEVNLAPVLTVPPNQVIDELTKLTVTNFASDPDIPANVLTFALVSAPANLVLNSANGVITWTPTEAQGPGNYVVTVRVYDNGTPSLSATNSFTVTVNEVNAAPVWTSVPVTNARVGEVYSYVLQASDAEGDALSFSAPTLPAWLKLQCTGQGGSGAAKGMREVAAGFILLSIPRRRGRPWPQPPSASLSREVGCRSTRWRRSFPPFICISRCWMTAETRLRI